MAATINHNDAHGVRTITLDRPKQLNAINLDMIEELERLLLSGEEDDSIRVVLLRGAGRAFCAGDDVEAQASICEAGEAALRHQLERLQKISALLTLGRKISIAAVQGWAIGAGFSWSFNCDFRIWSEEACGFFPEVEFGTFVTGGATYLVPRLLGAQRAHELLFLGGKLSAKDAAAAGLLHSVCASSELDDKAAALARDLADRPPLALSLMKQALADRIATGLHAAFEWEIGACLATTLDPATLRRMRAAIAKA